MQPRLGALGLLISLSGCADRAEPGAGGTGAVEGTVVDLASKVAGRLTEVHVKEGQRVEAGARLAVLDCVEPKLRLAQAQAQLEAARAESQAAQGMAEAEGFQGSAASAQANASAARAEALAAQKGIAARDQARLSQVGKYATPAQLDRVSAQAEGLGLEVKAAKAQTEAASRTARAARVRAGSAQSRAIAAASQVEALEGAVALAEAMVAECVLIAPRAGYVEDIFYDVGEIVPPGMPALRLIDLTDVWVTFYLDNASLGQITVGERAEVIADAWPGEPFVGTISTVGLEAEFTPRNIQTKDDRTRLVYPVQVRLENREGRLRPGMPVTARVLGRGPA